MIGLTATIASLINATDHEHDVAGNIISVTDAKGRKGTFTYDLNGRSFTPTEPKTARNATSLDGWRKPRRAQGWTAESQLEQVACANGVEQRLTYDLAGNVIAETDADGSTKQQRYDRMNRLTWWRTSWGTKRPMRMTRRTATSR